MAQQAHKAQVTGWVGWIAAASALIFLSGVIHMIYGFAGIFNQGWYVSSGTVYLLNTAGWGWTMLGVGALMILAAALLFAGNMFGRILAGILVVGSLIANFALLGVAPIWSIIAIVVDVVVLYAIIAHGSEMKHLDDETM